jgi:uncharacterized membrane protein
LQYFRPVLTILLTLLMLAAGITHFTKTRAYLRIVPEFLPSRILIVQLSGLIELAAGIGLCIPASRYPAATLVLLLMIVFLPLHIWDVFRERPAMGSRLLAWIRLPIQLLLIAWAWYVRG